MKKTLRLLTAMVLTVFMVMSVSMTAFAVDDPTYTITMKRAAGDTTNHTYEAYQVFTGKLSGEGSNAVLNDIDWGSGVDVTKLLAALKSDTTYGDRFVGCADAADVAKVLDKEAYDSDLAKFFAAAVGKNLSATNAGTAVLNGSTESVNITGLAAGYYFIKDEDGTQTDKENGNYTRFILKVVKNETVTAKADFPTLDKKILEGNGYIFGEHVLGRILQGRFTTTDALENADDSHFLETKSLAGKDSKHYLQLLRAFDDMKGIVGLKQHQVRAVFRKLFSTNLRSRYRILAIDGNEFTAFIINNEKQLKIELREVATDLFYDLSLELEPRKVSFTIPEEDLFRYDSTAKDDSEYMSNAFKKYSAGNASSKTRSMPELLFERYCEDNADIDWVYKNGAGGSQYFSIVYLNGTGNQQLFYPDYIVRKRNGEVWIIETKGGEQAGRSKNIDRMVEIKFNALKEYCRDYKLKWGFVRDMDGMLYINNTKYVEDMKDKKWVPLKEKF